MNVLWQAAERIREHGWIQETYGDESVGFCMSGALNCTGQIDDHVKGYSALQSVLWEQYGTRSVVDVNDCMMSSADEAIAMLEKAAMKLDEVS